MKRKVPNDRDPSHKGNTRWIWLLLVLSAAAVYPAWTENIAARAYDAATAHLYRAVVFSRAISDGALYPRWAQFLHIGLGSPIFTFQGPLPYFGLDVLYRLGIPHPIGWRILIGLGLLAASVGTYLLVLALTGRRWPAVIAAIAYLYAPYVLRNALERGSNEAYSMFFYPWVLWALVWLAQDPSGGRFAAATLLWALCIGTHVLGPLILAPFALLTVILLWWRYRTLAPAGALLAGGLLTAFIWAPMIPEQRWVQLDRDFNTPYVQPAHNPIPLDALLAAPELYDVLRDNNGTGDRVGLIHLALLVLGIPATFWAWRVRRRNLAIILATATAVGLLLFWMLTRASDPVWLTLEPLLTRLEFRTRLMGVQALAIAIVAGTALSLLPGRGQRYAGPVLAVILVLVALPSLFVGLQHRWASFGATLSLEEVRAAEIKAGGSAFASFSEFLPVWRKAPFDQAFLDETGPMFDPEARPLAHPPAGVKVKRAEVRSGRWDLEVEASEPVTLTLYLLYYPRWHATVDGRPAELRPETNTGYVQLEVGSGSHRVALRYGPTVYESAGIALSLAVLLCVVVIAVVWRRSGARVSHFTPSPRLSPEFQSNHETMTPPLWLLVGLTALLAFKATYLDRSTTWLRCISAPERICGTQATVDIPFTSGPRLRGYTVKSSAVRPGGTVQVKLFWQGEEGLQNNLYSFVHIRNSQKGWPLDPRSGSEIWAQDNHQAPGGLASSDFLPGRLYVDEYRVELPSDIPPGTYFLEIGWFDPATGEQLDPQADAVKPPLEVLWRSVLLPSITVR